MSTVNVMTWEPEQRRTGSLASLGIAIALAVAGVAVWWFMASAPGWLYWAFLGALVLVLLFQLALLFAAPRAASSAEPAMESAAPMPAPVEQAPPAAAEPQVLTLRCGDCGTVFDITDTGQRPLYHTCPGCGAEGALHAPEAPAEAASAYAPPPQEPAYALDASAAASAPRYAAASPAQGAPVAAAAPAAPVKKLKLRCGGCKEVFVIEDNGERPLKRPCPHCGRTGVIH